MSSDTADLDRVPPLLKAGEVLISHPDLADEDPAVIKELSLTNWTKRGWQLVDPDPADIPPPVLPAREPATDPKAQDAAKPSSPKNKEH